MMARWLMGVTVAASANKPDDIHAQNLVWQILYAVPYF